MIGFDIDGVLVNDINPEEWTTDFVDQMLAVRAAASPMFIPLLVAKATGLPICFVTARPNFDAGDTRAWLDRNHMKGCLLFTQPSPNVLSFKEAAAFKASVIKEHGITTFIESDIEQVEVLANLCPNVSITHFGGFLVEALTEHILEHQVLKVHV